MRARHLVLGAAAVLAASVLLAAWLLPDRLDPVRVRDALIRAAAERLHAAVTIDGPVHFALLPRPVLQASRVSLLHGAPGDADALAVTADTLAARLDLTALWHGRFAAAAIVLDGAIVQAPFPFDIRVLTIGRPDSLRAATILLRNAEIRVGPLVASQVDARFVADRLTGDISLSGSFRLQGGSAWRAGLHLSRPGGDGSAALDAKLDEIYAADGISASLGGQLAGDGNFVGRVAASGPNLAHLLPAPAVPFEVSGRAGFLAGTASLEDGALTLDGVGARLDAALRLPPQPRLDLVLAAGRLDLDAWMHALAQAPPRSPGMLPISLDLNAESASLGGGVLRQLRGVLTLDGQNLTSRGFQVVLPGDATLQSDGAADFAAATSRFDVRLDSKDLRATAAWLTNAWGGIAPSDLPDGPFRSLVAHAIVETAGREMEVHDVSGQLDGVGVRGDLILSASGGAPSLAAMLALDRLDLAPWLAGWRDGMEAWPWRGLDASVRLTSPRALVPDMDPARIDADFSAHAGAVVLRRLDLSAPAWTLSAHGSRATDGTWSDIVATATAEPASRLAPVLPASWRARAAAMPSLFAQNVRLTLAGSGTTQAPSLRATVDLGDLHIEAATEAPPAASGRQGSLSLRHPSARRLAALLGWSADFLGDGPLTASAKLSADGGTLAAEDFRLRAGLLDAGGALSLDWGEVVPTLSGHVDASVLALPAYDVHAATPLPLWMLRGWTGGIDLTAAQTTGLAADLSDLRAHVSLDDATLDIEQLAARLPGGGQLGGRLDVRAAETPPRVTAALTFGAVDVPAGPWRPLAVAADDVSGSLRLEARGYAPAALLATLQGEADLSAPSASLDGIGVADLAADLSDAAVRRALAGGRTRLESASATLRFVQGLATLQAEAAVAGGGTMTAEGTFDLLAVTADLGLAVTPAGADPPRIGLRVSGDLRRATATPALADLAQWRLSHPP